MSEIPASTKSSKNLEEISRAMSALLRHTPEMFDPALYPDYSTPIDKLLLNLNSNKKLTKKVGIIDINDINIIIDTNGKDRFKIIDNVRIRASQGHSDAVAALFENSTSHLTDFVPDKHFDESLLAHGTYTENVSNIMNIGLLPGNRNCVHMAFTGVQSDDGVVEVTLRGKSGMRNTCTALIIINYHQAIKEGHKFYVSDNGVILYQGTIPPCFLSVIFL